MNQFVKIFNCHGVKLEKQVNQFIDGWEADPENLGHLEVFGVTALDIKLIGGHQTEIWVPYNRIPMPAGELRLRELALNPTRPGFCPGPIKGVKWQVAANRCKFG